MSTHNELGGAIKKMIMTNVSESMSYEWPEVTDALKKRLLRQAEDSLSIYNNGGIFGVFEKRFARYHNRKHALLFSSGTAAIHAMYVVAGLGVGDEVICPAYTFFATVTPLLQTGAIPILCDCDENGNIDPIEIAKKITSRTKAVVITHMWGIPCQMKKIVELCRKNNLLLLEDCSHAHGAKVGGKVVGSFGQLSAWSIQGQKVISGGEGGVFATNDDELYYKALLFGHYNKRCKTEIPTEHRLYKFATTGMGLKLRAHPLAIAIADELLSSIDKARKNRHEYAMELNRRLKQFSRIVSPPKMNGEIEPSWYAFIIQVKGDNRESTRAKLIVESLNAMGLPEFDLPTSTCPLNLLPLFQEPGTLFDVYKCKNNTFKYLPGQFPRAETYYRSAVKLPIWSSKRHRKVMNKYFDALCNVLAKVERDGYE
ncbi:MAG: aminotransferase class I/II-fold pyridoxal phosphate-dependent enzyme [bacterium]|nr:aminotransferase class I/II-fold pyridoxal phosphate-dependent enzyme [bacterium]